ncbi:MAG: signal peptide peptidase SppA [Pseudomonadota bacterium]
MNEPLTLWKGLTAMRTIFANLLFLLFLLLLLILFGLWLGRDSAPALPERFALDLTFDGAVVEGERGQARLADLLSGPTSSATLLSDVLRGLELAQSDERVASVVLDTGGLAGTSLVTLNSIGDAIDALRKSGKSVLAYGGGFDQSQYVLASHADELYLHPMGSVLLTGLASYQPYLASLAEKLKIDVHVFRVGDYKSAVEPYTRSDMSAPARANSERLLGGIWERLRDELAGNRGLAPESLDALVAALPARVAAAHNDMALLAVEERLVDELLSPDAFEARIADSVGVERDALERVDLRRYLAESPAPQREANAPQIAVLTARGPIGAPLDSGAWIDSDRVVEQIREVRDSDRVAALVLRVDSPGGSAFDSELIRQELELLQLAGTPVVASFAGVAASGGYWIAATADRIVASPDSITGSIGVFSILPTVDRSLAEVGVRTDGVSTHPIAGLLDPTRPLPDGTRQIVQSVVDSIYDRFTDLVRRGRDIGQEDFDALAGGRVWSGREALALGLVDALGDRQTAIDSAAELAGLASYEIKELRKAPTRQEMLLEALSDSLRDDSARGQLDLGALAGAAAAAAAGEAARFAPLAPAIVAGLEPLERALLTLLFHANLPERRVFALCESCGIGF